jgi:hypothetical protein
VTYRAELSGRALKQMHGLPGPAFDSLIEVMAEVIDYPDDPLRTFPTGDPYVRRAEFGDAGLITYLNKRRHQQSHHPRHHLGWLAIPARATCTSARAGANWSEPVSPRL